MGPVPLSWCEIGEWQRQVAVTLAPWEARLLRQLSVVFIGESHRAESENCAAPWYTPVTDQERAAEAALMKKLFW